MTVFKRNVHLGTKDPLIETDDIADKSVTLEKLADETKNYFENVIIDDEKEARIVGDTNLEEEITDIKNKIPTEASSSNKLADKDYVDNQVSTNTATFKGTYNSLADLQAVEADNNDYGFVITHDADNDIQYARYKYNGTQWVFEYKINNNNFSPAQWAAINSGINQTGNEKLNALIVRDNPQVINLQANDTSQRFNIPVTVGTKLIFHVTEITGTAEGDMIDVNVDYDINTRTSEGYDVHIGDNVIWDAHYFYSQTQAALQANKDISVVIEAYVGVKGYIYPIYDVSIVNTVAPGLMSANDKVKLGDIDNKLLYVVRDDNKLRVKDANNINRGYIAGDSGKLEIKANEALSLGSNDGNISVNAKNSNVNLTGAKVNIAGSLSVQTPVGDGTILLNKKATASPATFNYIKIGDTNIEISSEEAIKLLCESLKIGSNNDIVYNNTDKKLGIVVDEVRIKDVGDNQRVLIDDVETKFRGQNGDSSISLQDSDFRVVFPNAGDIKFIASGASTPYTTLRTLVTASKRLSININSYLQADKPMPLGGSYNYTTGYGNVILQVASIENWYEGSGNVNDLSFGNTIVAMGYKKHESNDSAIYNRYTAFFFNVDADYSTLQYYKTVTQSTQINTLSNAERAALVSLGYTLDKEIIGTLSNLATTDKSSIVSAINELINAIEDNEQVVANALADLDARISNLEQPQV